MPDKYWIITQPISTEQSRHMSKVYRPDGNGWDWKFDITKGIENDAENITGLAPQVVCVKSIDRERAEIVWCCFTETSAITFLMLAGDGKIEEREWPTPMAGLSEEEYLIKFFEVVVVGHW